ncbi:hypothetical protein [Jannaschia formosa]|uniref:hypothetical protein n=1 Tax=Jannaschia formosa TaxID=2259592 RepID=UPI001074EC3E|nr:hypothetical protein [Jannaschia formosa]TFL18738.1 hypothetical protein DR046_07360 [Jannaschia formosa]
MNRLAASVLALLLCAPVGAQADVTQDIVRRLQAEGFERIEISRTFLGRTRIVASGPPGQREVVVNPRSGEVLRDYFEDDDDDDRRRGRSGDEDGGGSSGPGGGSDDDSDDDDDDDDDDDGGDDD